MSKKDQRETITSSGCRAPLRGEARLALEEAVLRPRQAQILAQGLALIFPAEDAAALELGHHALHHIVEPAGR
jgi:hypothetical protein